MNLKRFLFIVLFFTVCAVHGLMHARHVQADENFSYSLNATYSVNATGDTLIDEKLTVTNKKPTLYAKQYGLEIGATKIKNVRAFDDSGDIQSNVVTTNNKTTIGITFADAVVGEGKSRTFTIQYSNPDSAIISGNVLEVYIPKFVNAKDYDNYVVTLKTPGRFGTPARVSPQQYQMQQDPRSGQITLTFAHLANQSVSALFGDKQIFDYTLRYNLDNPTGNNGIIQIALPPDTARQKMQYISLDPQPIGMEKDSDGNWIATYEIAAQKNLDVFLTGKATLFLNDQNPLPFEQPSPDLTQEQKYWEVSDPRIQALAAKYHTPREIYDYVVTHLSYNYSRIGGAVDRLGAVQALANPENALCQEFTDLFIALARANHIPARRMTGFAYTENDKLRPLDVVEDVLHAWPEYYDAQKQVWIPVDPTWGNTTGGINYFDEFDFNHLTFAINGESSTTPYSAGAYKREDTPTKDVEVKFGQEIPFPKPDFDVQIMRVPSLLMPFMNQYKMTVTNKTGVAFYDVPLQLATDSPDETLSNPPGRIDYLLPFQRRDIYFTVKSQKWLVPQSFHLTSTLDNLSSSHELTSGFQVQEIIHSGYTPIILGACVAICAIIAGGVLVSRRKR